MADWDLGAVTEKWQEQWWANRLHHAEHSDDGKPTYFIHFAYPGISGFLHVGHMRGFTYTDVFGRYKRMTGHNVLFPAGFHASGIPAVAFAKEVERGEKTEYLRSNGFDGDLAELSDPRKVVDYFAHVYTHDYWKKFGFLIDDRRNCTTIDDGYKRFIQWQFRRLNDKGWLVQKPHYAPFCPVAGPVAVDKSETDIKQGGSAEIQEYVALRFTIPAGDLVDTDDNFDAIVLPCATLRPETIYGVTNLWIHPEHEYELVRVWKDGAVADDDLNEVWLVSQQGRTKLEWQMERAEGLDLRIPGGSLIGLEATAPVTGRRIPIVKGDFVDPMIASGVVMSVPAHAPFDWAAYVDAGLDKTLGDPPRILNIEGYDDLPARQACNKFGVTSQLDKAALDQATDQVYSDEFNKGILTDACGPYAGKRVKAIKDDLKQEFVAADHGRLLRQFSDLVISRAGEVVDVRRIPDQDFVHYSDEAWTEMAQAHAANMTIFPQRYQDDIENVLTWFGDRACVRRGAWLGTPFPFKPDWVIEPIADSTFYPWFYVVSLYVNDGRLPVDELSEEFFDYVFNGKGEAASPLWGQIRRDVLYWGPVDINLGGKEHQTVHFPVYIMNMVGLMEDAALWPRGIFVNWWVTQKAGAKISKSKGGSEPIPGAAERYGVDPMRLYYCHVGSPHVDIEWDPEIVLSYRQRVQRVGRLVDDVLEVAGGPGPMDAWLEARFAQVMAAVKDSFEAYDVRTAATELVYTVPDVIRWYQRRGGENRDLLRRVVQDWAKALCPMLPHVAEEAYERAGGDGLCSVQSFPEWPAGEARVLENEQYLLAFLDDAKTIRKLANLDQPEKLTIFTSPAWKRSLLQKAAAMGGNGQFPMGAFMGQIMQDPAMRQLGKAVQKFAGKLPGQLKQMNAWQAALVADDSDEVAILRDAGDFIASEIGVATVAVFQADDEAAPDHPKRNVAEPFKPGVALE